MNTDQEIYEEFKHLSYDSLYESTMYTRFGQYIKGKPSPNAKKSPRKKYKKSGKRQPKKRPDKDPKHPVTREILQNS